MNLTWRPSESASAFHAAELIASARPLADSRLAPELAKPTAELVRCVHALGLPPARFWQHVVPLAATIENNRQLARAVLIKLARASPPDHETAVLAGLIADLEAAFRRATPNVVQELALRGKPIRELFEGRGPGLLIHLGERTDPRLILESAEVILIHPAAGGGGVAHLPYNSARIEAVLANPLPELPEVARLGYLLGQLNTDLPMFSESVHRDRLPLISSLALIPPALQAAQDVELCKYDAGTLAAAIEHWAGLPGRAAELADTLHRWWSVHLDARPPWKIALAALDQLVGQ